MENSYINLDINLTFLDLSKYHNLEKIELNEKTRINNLIINFNEWYLIKNYIQLENLEILNIDFNNISKLEEKNDINFGIYSNLRELTLIHSPNIKILFTNMINLKKLILKEMYYDIRLDLKDCINLEDLSLESKKEINIEINQNSIKILELSNSFKNINLSKLVNLEILKCLDVGQINIDLSNNKKLVKLIGKNLLCRFKDISESVEYIKLESVGWFCQSIRDVIDSKNLEKLIKLKYFNAPGHVLYSLNLNKLIELEELHIKTTGNIQNINPNIKILDLEYYDAYSEYEFSEEEKYIEVVNIRELQKLTKLKYLGLNNCYVKFYDLSFLKELEELHISGIGGIIKINPNIRVLVLGFFYLINSNKYIFLDNIKNLESLRLKNVLIKELNLYNCTKLNDIKLYKLYHLEYISLPYNFEKEVYAQDCPKLIIKNKIINRRRIYLLSELNQKYICRRCKKYINFINLSNTRIYYLKGYDYKIINSCC